jgi:inosose dehydratase
MSLSRRELLKTVPVAVAMGSSMSRSYAAVRRVAGADSLIHLGAQTNAWPIDPQNFDSFLGVLNQIRQVGYAGFETGYFNLPKAFAAPGPARAQIESTGLVFFAVHIALPAEKNDSSTKIPSADFYKNIAPGALTLGAKHLIVSSSPSVNAEDTKRKADALNAAGTYCQNLGLPLAYHNHEWEFDSKYSEIESLYELTDPNLVHFVFDAGHAYHAGADIPSFLQKHYARIIGLHLRDYRDGVLVPLGQGTFPLAQAAATLQRVQWSGWALNDEDRDNGPKLGLQVIEPAFKALHGAFA